MGGYGFFNQNTYHAGSNPAPPQWGTLFFALFSDSFNKNIEMSVVSFCCFLSHKQNSTRTVWFAICTEYSI